MLVNFYSRVEVVCPVFLANLGQSLTTKELALLLDGVFPESAPSSF